MTATHIQEFELIDHGIENSQYFQGCGTAFTDYVDVATGIGDNPAEAIDDALDSLAQMGYDVDGMEARIMADLDIDELPTMPEAHPVVTGDREQDDDSGDELYYHVSIRVK